MASDLIPTNSEVGTNAHELLVFWFSLQIIAGHVFLPFLLVIFILSKRHITLINLCIVWIISGISSCLLLYTGYAEGPEPPVGLCLIQSALIYGIPPMTSTACLALVFHVWTGIFRSNGSILFKKLRVIHNIALLAAPYIVFCAFSVATAWLGFHRLDQVSRNRRFFYCSLRYSPLSHGISAFCCIILTVTIIFGIWIAVILYKNWRAFRQGHSEGGFDLNLILRVAAFSLFVLSCQIVSFISIRSPKSPVPDLWIASIGTVVVLIFGSQRAVWETVAWWKKDSQKDSAAALLSHSSDGPTNVPPQFRFEPKAQQMA